MKLSSRGSGSWPGEPPAKTISRASKRFRLEGTGILACHKRRQILNAREVPPPNNSLASMPGVVEELTWTAACQVQGAAAIKAGDSAHMEPTAPTEEFARSAVSEIGRRPGRPSRSSGRSPERAHARYLGSDASRMRWREPFSMRIMRPAAWRCCRPKELRRRRQGRRSRLPLRSQPIAVDRSRVSISVTALPGRPTKRRIARVCCAKNYRLAYRFILLFSASSDGRLRSTFPNRAGRCRARRRGACGRASRRTRFERIRPRPRLGRHTDVRSRGHG